MPYKVTIGDTVLEKCIQHVSFNIDTYNGRKTTPRNSILITGQIDIEEGTIELYKWALISGANPNCYKEITVEQYQKNLLVRKVSFKRAFVIDYSDNYSNYAGTGTFKIYIRQLFTKEVEITSQETNTVSNIEPKIANTVKEPESVQQNVTLLSPSLNLTRKGANITDKLAKVKEMQDNGSISSPLKEVKYGEQFTKKDGKKVLKPNVTYTTLERYTYKTDDLGRIISVEGTLELGEGKRNAYAQRTVGRDDREIDDDGGHLIASIFKGSGGFDNLVPMNGNLNKGEWKKLENDWAKALNATPPKDVKVKITPMYEGDSLRPTKFRIEQKIGNRKPETRILKNRPGGK